MKKAGVKTLYVGVETGSQKILKLLNKKLDLKELFILNRKLDFNVVYNFMIGFPGETKEDIKDSIKVIRKLLIENPKATISPLYSYTPYPGTVLYEKSIKTGFVPPTSLQGWADFDWKHINLPWILPSRKRLIESLYLWSLFLARKPSMLIPEPFRTLAYPLMPILRKIAWSRFQKV